MIRKVILYIATSLDGYIAKPNDDLSFLSMVEQEDYGYTEFVKTVDAVIVGRKTYDKVISMGFDSPYAAARLYRVAQASTNIHFKYAATLNSMRFFINSL